MALPRTLVEIGPDHPTVALVTRALVDAFFDAVDDAGGEPPPPAVLFGGIGFFHGMLRYMASRMGLSPDQRESFYETALGLLRSAVQAETEALFAAPAQAQPRPRPKRRTKRGVQP